MLTLNEIRARLQQASNTVDNTAEQRRKHAEQEKIVKLLKGHYVDRHAQVMLNPGLECPRCRGIHLHHVSVELFNREEDAVIGDHFTIVVPESHGWMDEYGADVAVPASTVDTNMLNNPSARRTGVVVNFVCEGCGPGLALNIAQHQGTSDMSWTFKQYQEFNK